MKMHYYIAYKYQLYIGLSGCFSYRLLLGSSSPLGIPDPLGSTIGWPRRCQISRTQDKLLRNRFPSGRHDRCSWSRTKIALRAEPCHKRIITTRQKKCTTEIKWAPVCYLVLLRTTTRWNVPIVSHLSATWYRSSVKTTGFQCKGKGPPVS